MYKSDIEKLRKELYAEIMQKSISTKEILDMPKEFLLNFDLFIEECILQMLKEGNNFFANFVVSLRREIDFKVSEAMATKIFTGYFVLYINPYLILDCSLQEIHALIKHEIYHILSLHHVRAYKLYRLYSRLAVNLAMDISINQYIANLPPWSKTLENVSKSFNVVLEADMPLEFYAERIQHSINKLIRDKKEETISDDKVKENIDLNNIESFHEFWNDSENKLEESQVLDIVNKMIKRTSAANIPESIEILIEKLNKRPEITWQRYLIKEIGMLNCGKRKTITRKDRRQPERMDIRGTLARHISEVIVALDTSGSMTDIEMEKSLIEILSILKNYPSKITVIECDEEIRKVYRINSKKDIKSKPKTKGKTRFSPVFKFIKENHWENCVLMYFTDGLGEDVIDKSLIHKKTLWVITSLEGKLSLKDPFGTLLRLKTNKIRKNETLPLEYLKSELKDVRSEWAK